MNSLTIGRKMRVAITLLLMGVFVSCNSNTDSLVEVTNFPTNKTSNKSDSGTTKQVLDTETFVVSEIQAISQEINQNENYALGTEELDLLVEENAITTEELEELKKLL